MKIIKYIILYAILCGISIIMCYFDRFIDRTYLPFLFFLINFCQFLSWIVLIIGAVKILSKYKSSNKKVWVYYTIMMSTVGVIKSFVELITSLI